MTLRLSSSGGTGPTSIDGYMKQITEDTSISLTQKSDCLKTLTVVLKNLVDATKGASADGAKYRTLKTDNPKLRSRLFCCESVTRLLLDPSLVGMVSATAADGTPTVTVAEAPSPRIRDVIGLRVLPAISTARRDIDARLGVSGGASKKARLDADGASGSVAPRRDEKLSEKQKARRLLEEKERLEKERDRRFRIETRAKIAADKLVRRTDENWKPSVSAAADKTGTGLLTFRDRHGE